MKDFFIIKSMIIIFIIVLISACCPYANNQTTLRGNGELTSQEKILTAFDNVVLSGVGTANIHFSDEFKIVVNTDSNIQEFISLNINENTLNISQNSNINLNYTRLVYDIYLPEIKSITTRGAGNINIDSGNATDLEIHISGVGNVNTLNYEVENVYIVLSGVGNARVWATYSIHGRLSGVGDIMYKGNPSNRILISGIGTVKQI